MRGEQKGLKTKILQQNDKAIFVYCYRHALNLAVKDSTKSIELFNDLLDTTYELTKLIKKSPKREEILNSLKKDAQSTVGGV